MAMVTSYIASFRAGRYLLALIACLLLISTSNMVTGQGMCGTEGTTETMKFGYHWRNPIDNTPYVCPADWYLFGTHCYKLFSDRLAWDDAKQICSNNNGQLAKVVGSWQNEAIAKYVLGINANISNFWIGLSSEGVAANMVKWCDETVTDIAIGKWANFQPDTKHGECGSVNTDANYLYPWSLRRCADTMPFVCQQIACLSDEFACSDGKCIPQVLKCDGDANCADAGDEMDCANLCKFKTTIGSNERKTLQTPNYPSKYNSKPDCIWVLEGPIGKKLTFKLLSFETEQDHDIMSIYVGGSTLQNSRYAGSISGGHSSMSTFVSTNNWMILVLRGDGSVEKAGFKGEYTTDYQCKMEKLAGWGRANDPSPESIAGSTEDACKSSCQGSNTCQAFTYTGSACIAHRYLGVPVKESGNTYWGKTCPQQVGTPVLESIPGAGGTLYASKNFQFLTSPLYPFSCLSNSKVGWLITAPKFSIITVQLLDLHLGVGDTITVYDGANAEATVLQKYTGDGSDSNSYVMTTAEFAYVYMETHSTEGCRGLQLQYVIGCEIALTASHGIIQTPAYGIKKYPNMVTCSWTVKTAQMRGVLLHSPDNKPSDLADGDSLTVYSGSSSSATQLGTLPFGDLSSQSGELFIKFESVDPVNGNGYYAVFSMDCSPPSYGNDSNMDITGNMSTQYLSTFTVSCKEGYIFEQQEFRTPNNSVKVICELGGKWNYFREPTCIPVFCSYPPDVPNGFVKNSTTVLLNGEVEYECFEGFSISGSNPITCQANASWSTPPTCTATGCVDPVVPEFGSENRTNVNTYGSIVKFTCDAGYEITAGVPLAFCDKTPAWSGNGTQCSGLPCVVPIIEHATMNVSSVVIPYSNSGSVIVVTCDSGYAINGTNGTETVRSITCQSDLLFGDIPACVNINDCEKVPSVCTQGCVDTHGGYYCTCEDGYELNTVNNKTCDDINECADDNGGCAHNCTNMDGNYTCECMAGYALFEFDGFNGFSVATGESGLRDGDVYHINHTCVRVTCPVPTGDVIGGKLLLNLAKQYYYYEDTYEMLCDIGYVVDGTNNSRQFECQADGTWSGQPPNCSVAECPALVLPDTLLNKPNISTTNPVPYNGIVNMECIVPGGTDHQRQRKCLYNSVTKKYELLGDALDCGVIDCGQLSTADQSGVLESLLNLTDTRFNDSFVFACRPGFMSSGGSGQNSTTVYCQSNGRWDLGNLRCTGATCSDPGRPPDGYQELVPGGSYEQNQEVTFKCNRPGFQPTPSKIKCVADNQGNVTWDDNTAPSCQDKEAPKITCPTEVIKAKLYEVLTIEMPAVSDNSGSVRSVTATPDMTGIPVTEAINITYTAIDHAGNAAEPCVRVITLIDEQPPSLDSCLQSREILMDSSNPRTEQISIAVINATTPGSKTITNIEVIPSVIEVNTANLYKPSLFSIVATDSEGYTDSCRFQIVIKKEPCGQFAMRQPKNGPVPTCVDDQSGNFNCSVKCNDGYVFYNQTSPLQYSCNKGSAFQHETLKNFIPDCIQPSVAPYTQRFKIVYSGSTVNSSLTTFIADYTAKLSALQTSLQNECDSDLVWTDDKPPNVIVTKSTEFVLESTKPTVTLDLEYKKVTGENTNIPKCADHLTTEIRDISNKLTANALNTIGAYTYVSTEIVQDGFSCPDGGLLQQESATSSVCAACSAGTYAFNGTCELCAVGWYSSSQNSAQCSQCPSGSSTMRTGSTSIDDCHPTCPAGFISDDGMAPCQACPADTYWLNTTHCESCPGSSKTKGLQGGEALSDCKDECPLGHYSVDGYEPCIACPRGFYQGATNQKNCIACSDTTHSTPTTGANNTADCAAVTDICDPNPCGNGTCAINKNVRSCTCNAGYTGETCESDIDECASNPCYYGATCVNKVDGYTCLCIERDRKIMVEYANEGSQEAAFAASNSPNINHCKEVCLNDTKCVVAVWSPKNSPETCLIYYSAQTLEQQDVSAQIVALVKKDDPDKVYSGSQCEVEENDCNKTGNVACKHASMCQDQIEGFKCLCIINDVFSGTYCDQRDNICNNFGCQHGGSCEEISEIRAACKCAPGYTGDKCETQIDMCEYNPCLYGGTCTSLVNAFKCTCPTGFTGDKCQIRPAANALCNANPCGDGSNCYEDYTTSSVRCICKPHFTSGEYMTDWVDVDYPLSDNATYQQHSDNACNGGSTVVMANCRVTHNDTVYEHSDMHVHTACTSAHDKCVSAVNATCMPFKVRYKCDAGGSQCIPDNVCLKDDSPCKNNAKCTMSETLGFVCTPCTSGFQGFICQHDINECESDPCQNGATCNDFIDHYNCTCAPGYEGDNCQTDIDDCLSKPCNLTGTQDCKDKVDDFLCICKPGYKGQLCDVEINECESNPCRHGATCIDLVDGYSCNCTLGWESKDCDQMVKHCQEGICQNGECEEVFNRYFCRCFSGFYGDRCEHGPDPCTVANPCQNGGTCSVSGDDVKCSCETHYTGSGCEVKIDYCSNENFCQNGATCLITDVGGFECVCVPGFTGVNCEINIDDCVGVSCGEGTCVDGVQRAFCRCPFGKTGPMCGKDINRDVDYIFGGREGCAKLLYPVLLNSTSVSLSLWVRYDEKNTDSMYLKMYKVNSRTSTMFPADQVPFVAMNSTGVTVSNGSDLATLSYATGVQIDNGEWHQVAVVWNDGKVKIYNDGIDVTGSADSPADMQFYSIVMLGCELKGAISLVQVWNRALSFEDTTDIVIAKQNAVTTANYETDLVLDWGYGLYRPSDLQTRVIGSVRGINCKPGEFADLADGGQCKAQTKDTVPPKFDICPADKAIEAIKPYMIVDYTTPVASDHSSLDNNYDSGIAYSAGVSPVIYIARDTAGNRATCKFNIFLRLGICATPNAPLGGEEPQCSEDQTFHTKRCSISCPTGKAFLRPHPKVYSCGASGVWRRNINSASFRFPPCGDMGTVTTALHFSWVFKDIVSTFSSSIEASMLATLLDKFKTWSATLSPQFCPQADCSDLKITVTESTNPLYAGKPHVDCQISGLSQKFGNLTAAEAVTLAALLQNKFLVPNLLGGDKAIDPTTFNIEQFTSCDPMYQPVGDNCVGCTPGTYYNAANRTCDDCPIGFYQTDSLQSNCTQCNAGYTTQTTGSNSSAACVVQCSEGNFFNETTQQCEVCGIGLYQPEKGKFCCIACDPGTTTRVENATSQTQCFSPCSSGYQIGVEDNNCIPCQVGYYHTVGVTDVCTKCPSGWTTANNASTHAANCSRKICDNGYYRVGESTCVPCPLNTYRTAEMANCTSCGNVENWRTLANASSSVQHCKFFCPAGQYMGTGASNETCIGCPLNTYKSLATDQDYTRTSCIQCPPAKPRTLSENSTSETACRGNCTAGEIVDPQNSAKCIVCPVDTYQPVESPVNETCIPCPANKGTAQNGSKLLTDCTIQCDAGKMPVGDVCVPCERGYYKEASQRFGSCVQCETTKITADVGSTSAADCNVGNCSAGEYIVGSSCEPCPVGKYQSKKWQTSCITCPARSSTKTTGSTSKDDCNVSPGRKKYGFRIKLNLPFLTQYADKTSSAYKNMMARILRIILAFLQRQILNLIIYQSEGVSLGPGSIDATLYLDVEDLNGTLLTQIEDALKQAITNGTIVGNLTNDPNDQLSTVTDSPLVAVDMNDTTATQVCSGGNMLDLKNGQCVPCPKDTYQPTGQTQVCLFCDAYHFTSGTGSTAKSDCKNKCQLDLSYCQNGGTCSVSTTTGEASCVCMENYEGATCQTRIDKSSESKVPLIIGLTIGISAGVMILMFIVAYIGYSRRLKDLSRKRRRRKEMQMMGPMAGAYPMMTASRHGYHPMGLGYPSQPTIGNPTYGSGQYMFYEDKDDLMMDAPASQEYAEYSNGAFFQRPY